VRGFEVAPGQFVVVEADELAEAQTALVRSRRIDIQAFVDLGEIEPIYFEASYYAEPLTEGRPSYALLQQAMRQTARAAIARLALRQRERLAALWPWEDALVVHTLYFADEVRSPATLDLPTEEADPRELRTAIRLIEAMAERFTPRRLPDEYYRRLMTIIEQKAEAGAGRPVAEGAGARPELLGELQASISAVQQSRRPRP
jgi:DNA end-binding protein Ku